MNEKKEILLSQTKQKTTLQVKVVTLFKKDACYRYFVMFFVVKAKHELYFILKIRLKGYFRNRLSYITVH